MLWVSTIKVLGFFGSTFPKTFLAIPGLKSLVSGQDRQVAAAGANSGITMADIQAVKDVVDTLGADTVQQLAAVLKK